MSSTPPQIADHQNQPTKIYLKDYRPHPFQVTRLHLELDIFEEKTRVTSELHVSKKDPLAPEKLFLNGESMQLHSVSLDGQKLSPEDYQVSAEGLTLLGTLPQHFVLVIQAEISPYTNTALEGFYQSGSILCTQCEPEGFRKISYFIDRPDNMCLFQTTLKADKKRYPYLLSNGNRVSSRDLPHGRHEVVWQDPFKKPCYLFAAVAGDLALVRDHFNTRSGRRVELEIYVDPGQDHKVSHAMESLKKSMKWDEDVFGLEYDLDIYMIVAVESFNFGAMENKGLNIFNSAYVLADRQTATDSDFQNIEGVVGHEYFHNWSGNRVTCRDWFQLTLKEGLTVFRDQEFSSDMLSREIKRIEDVKRLKEHQFPEDQGPMSHPIRPESYLEINNFYTATVYEKGAEVIRMLQTLIGAEAFKRGVALYFKRFDGQAVTTEDFISSLEEAAGLKLQEFRKWYERAGTPVVAVEKNYSPSTKSWELTFTQKFPFSPPHHDSPLPIPLKLAAFSSKGERCDLKTDLVVLKDKQEKRIFSSLSPDTVFSINREFSAPVLLEHTLKSEENLLLAMAETDGVAKHEAFGRLFSELLQNWIHLLKMNQPLPLSLPQKLEASLLTVLRDEKMPPAFKAYLFELPTEATIHQLSTHVFVNECAQARKHLHDLIGKTFFGEWKYLYLKHQDPRAQEQNAAAYSERAMKNRALSYLVYSQESFGQEALELQFSGAQTMTEEEMALSLSLQLRTSHTAKRVESFYKKWKHEPLVMLRWFALQAQNCAPTEAVSVMERLENDSVFRAQVPNDLRALYHTFGRSNLVAFHQESGAGYAFYCERIKRIDAINPQVAARLCNVFALKKKLPLKQQELLETELRKLVCAKISKDVFEYVEKYLDKK